MENGIQTEKNSKKKLIVPVVALMLCAVAVIGTGYALSSSVTVDDNTVDAEYLSLDLYNDASAATATAEVLFGATNMVTLTKSHTITSDASTYTPVVTPQDGSTVTKYLKVIDDNRASHEIKAKLVVTGELSGKAFIKDVKIALGDASSGVEVAPGGTEVSIGSITGNAAATKVTIVVEYNDVSAEDFDEISENITELKFTLTFSTATA